MKGYSRKFIQKVENEIFYDTKKYRYAARVIGGVYGVYRLSLGLLDATAFYSSWELVQAL